MIIFYGTKWTQKKQGEFEDSAACAYCSEEVFHEYYVHKKWFTLFWIPIIPLGKEHFSICPKCKSPIKLKKKDIANMNINYLG